MLVLVRKVREGFWIQDTIFVEVLEIRRNRVKLGVSAPNDIAVTREELQARRSRRADGGIAGESSAGPLSEPLGPPRPGGFRPR